MLPQRNRPYSGGGGVLGYVGQFGGRSRCGRNNDDFSNLRSINWAAARLPPFEKNFYQEHPKTRNRPPAEVER